MPGHGWAAAGPTDLTAALDATAASTAGLRRIRPSRYVGGSGSTRGSLHAEAYLATLAAA